MEKEILVKVYRYADRFPYIPNYVYTEMFNQLTTETHIVCKYVHEDEYVPRIAQIEGQVSLNSEFGKTIFFLMMKDEAAQKWLEVGTWNGNGTTTCVLEGLKHRRNKQSVHFVSYEGSSLLYKAALINMKRYDDIKEYFTLVRGRVPNSLPFPSLEDVREHTEHFAQHFEEEKYIYDNTPAVPIPFAPNVVILDGGEYTGNNDWNGIPKENLRHIFLDDIFTKKNMQVNKELETNPEWECVQKSSDRNGWAYYRRKSPGV